MKKGLLFLGAAIGLGAIEAMACSCAPVSVSDSYKKMDAIFEGKVISVKGKTGSSWSPKMVMLHVNEKFKGLGPERKVIIGTAAISASCGSHFEAGKAYLVYAYRNIDGTLETNLCTRTRQLSEAKADILVLQSLTKSH